MTDTLTARLHELAAATELPPLDLAGLHHTARGRTARTRVTAVLATVALVAAGVTGTVFLQRSSKDALQPARPGWTQPTPARLVHAVETSFPGTRIRAINRIPAGPMIPGGSPYYLPGRALLADELWFIDAATADGDILSVHWYVLDPPLSDDEADRYARGLFPPDPDPVPDPHAVRLPTDHDNSGSLKSLLYTYDQRINAYAWSPAGPLVTASLSAVSGDVSRGHLLDELARGLAGAAPGDAHGLAYPLEDFSHIADLSGVPVTGAKVGDLTGPRRVGCISVAKAVELANRDFTSDLDELGRPISPAAIVRVVATGTLRLPDRPLTLQVTVLLDAATGQVVSTGAQQLVPNGPPLPELTSLAGDEQPCPGRSSPQ